ncbi:GlxA family transcriptional regulator [Hellea balneolensis]|uniref:GlxA family transcriptional regulator n=1 Tax=Hellea balneolensis TaxID=287478 RepID=UPI0003F79F07|nr:GlxA family transcriptional regulator [Hellea balneolensis]
MFGQGPHNRSQKIGFILIPDFSMMAFTACIEPLRTANRLSRKPLYDWQALSLDGQPVKASNQVTITPDNASSDITDCDVIFICAGLRPRRFLTPQLSAEIRRFNRKGMPIGSVCTGSEALAYAGVLTGHRCTIHWENIETFKELYPALEITATLFEIDRKRYTCSGGTAPIDMMIHSIRLDHGDALAQNVAEQLLHNFVREPHHNQRMAIDHRTGLNHPKLLAAIGYMEAYIEEPLSLVRLAQKVELSLRQLERLFKAQLNTSPGKYYLNLRLERARHFLRQTGMSVMEIGLASGFNSASNFSRCYKAQFGHSPHQERL